MPAGNQECARVSLDRVNLAMVTSRRFAACGCRMLREVLAQAAPKEGPLNSAVRRRDLIASAVAAASVSRAVAMPASETVNIGCIGTGGRCRRLMRTLSSVPGTRIAAICDVWDDALAQARQISGPDVFATKDYRELLARPDVDAVIIGSPDHWHVPMTVDACNSGKDVYCEKPLTEGQAVILAQNDNERVVQVGTQQRSMPHFKKARAMLGQGILGTVHKVRLTWNRNRTTAPARNYAIEPASVDWKRFLGGARTQPFDPYRFRNWRWFWDFGGGILTDLMVHWMDAANWLLDLPEPSMATTVGDSFAMDRWETPDTVQTLLHYPREGVQVHFEGTFVNQRNRAMMLIMGTEGTMYLDRGRMEVYPEPGVGLEPQVFAPGTGVRGADFDVDGERPHLQNWIDAVRSRSVPNTPAEAGVLACASAHLANIAYRSGRIARNRRIA